MCIRDSPGDAKYGFTKEQMIEGYRRLQELGAEEFGIHAFLASNTTTNEYYPTLARILFTFAVELKEKTGAKIKFVNLSGGVGIPYRPCLLYTSEKRILTRGEPLFILFCV